QGLGRSAEAPAGPTGLRRGQGERRDDRRRLDLSDMSVDRRTLLAGLSAAMLAPRRAHAASTTDGAGRAVLVPARVERVFPAGPPAAIFFYTLSPRLLIGWPPAHPPGGTRILLPPVRPPPRGRQPRQSRSRARAQTRPHPGRRQRESDLCLARRPGAAADGHSLRAARRPFRGHPVELPHARRTDRAARAGRGPCPQRRR